jgi:hypothetical protein
VLRLGVVALLLAACGTESVAGSSAADAAIGVCAAREALPDRDASVDAFRNQAHEALHALAATPGLDRAVAADLLTAKVRVESAILDDAPAEELTTDLLGLDVALGNAAADLGLAIPACSVPAR